MRIGIDISAVSHGRGPARFTTEIVRALTAFAKSGDTFFLYSPSGLTMSKLAVPAAVRAVPLERFRPWLNWTLPRAAAHDRCDVMFFPANDCWLWRAMPSVVALLDIAPRTTLFEYLPGWKDRLQVLLQMGRVGRVADTIVTISRFSAGQIAGAVPGSRDKICVIFCGIGETFRQPEQPAGNRDGEEPYILFVGGFDRRKNIERLLLAYRELRGRGRRENLLMIGKGGTNSRLYYDLPELVNRCGLAKSVIVRQGVDDATLAEKYRHALLLVLPSIIEGFGLPVIEAQSCGCPVACSTAASLPEVGGDAASYFDPYDVAAMAGCMEKILTDESFRARLRERGFENVKRFSWSRSGEAVYGFLEEAAMHSNRHAKGPAPR